MLTVITGCMFAGKSSRLLEIGRANRITGKQVGYFKPSSDTRYSEQEIVTHIGKSVSCHSVVDATSIIRYLDMYDVFCIDEAQFFNENELIEVVEDLLYKHKKELIISGLSQDSTGSPFGAMPYLLAVADDIIHLKAVCAKTLRIGTASRTFRKDKNNKEQVVVGGTEMYEPRSFEAWIQ